MGWSEMEGRCRRHPKHRQSKGVCPSCLREKLSQLSASSSTHNSAVFSSPGSSYDSASSSAPSSSPGTPFSAARNHPRRRRRDIARKLALLMKDVKENPQQGRAREPLTKSRSLAFIISNPLSGGNKGKKKEKAECGMREDGQVEKKNEEGCMVEEGKDSNVDNAKNNKHNKSKEDENKTKKRSFWTKLAVGGKKMKEKDGLFHSKTVRETSSARWAVLP